MQNGQNKGLTSTEAEARLSIHGPNRLDGVPKIKAVVELLYLLANPLAIILLFASAISFVVGNWLDASIIGAMVLLSTALNFIQNWRSRSAMESLSKQVALTATVMRDGLSQEVDRAMVVPDDLISLSSGDLVPADARLVESRDFFVQEAALTGESLPVRKAAGTNEDDGLVFLGTSVISGTAHAVVTATGMATRFGAISKQLSSRPPETEFERGTRSFGALIARIVLLLVVFVFVVNALAHRDLLESLLFSIALGVGLTPEFLPMIMTVTLSQGARKMAKHKVIVKHLEAIQNFGSIDILCSDKTGTLTSGNVSLRGSVGPDDEVSEMPRSLAYLNSELQTGIKNPLDRALIDAGRPAGFILPEIGAVSLDQVERVDEIPFDFERRLVSVVVSVAGRRLLITKGAPESIAERAAQAFSAGETVPSDRKAFERLYGSCSERGERVIAVAYKFIAEKSTYSAADESQLTLAGLLTFADEPLPTASASLRRLAKDGISVKILTGDNELVARHVCDTVGLNSDKVILGSDIDTMNDDALAHAAAENNIFARVSPTQKNRILLALKNRGHVVGFLGDGINDAPSLHSADVGISVANATEVARDAAEIVLLEPGLDVLHTGIIEGRKSFGNVMKYLLMGTSSNFGNMFSMAGAVLFLPFLPMLPTQILLNNFLYDLAQITIPTDNVDASFIRKPHRWDTKHIRNFMLALGPVSSIYDFMTFGVLLYVFHATEPLFQTGWFVESLATQTLVVFIIRTAGNPLRSRPGKPLTITVLLVVAAALVIPFLPFATALKFVPLPAAYYVFLACATVTYLLIVEAIKRRFFPTLLD